MPDMQHSCNAVAGRSNGSHYTIWLQVGRWMIEVHRQKWKKRLVVLLWKTFTKLSEWAYFKGDWNISLNVGSQTTEIRQKLARAGFFPSAGKPSADWLPRQGSCVVSGKTDCPFSLSSWLQRRALWQHGGTGQKKPWPVAPTAFSYLFIQKIQKMKHW